MKQNNSKAEQRKKKFRDQGERKDPKRSLRDEQSEPDQRSHLLKCKLKSQTVFKKRLRDKGENKRKQTKKRERKIKKSSIPKGRPKEGFEEKDRCTSKPKKSRIM